MIATLFKWLLQSWQEQVGGALPSFLKPAPILPGAHMTEGSWEGKSGEANDACKPAPASSHNETSDGAHVYEEGVAI